MLTKRVVFLLAAVVLVHVSFAQEEAVDTVKPEEKPTEKPATEKPATEKPSGDKPQLKKFCPSPTGFAAGPCPFICKDDSSCRGEQMCCPTRCGGTTCSNPVTTQPVEAEVETAEVSTKEGECPGPYYTKDDCGLTHVATCVRDSQCLGSQKCCTNGCVHTCRRPKSTKTGECPSDISTTCNRKACIEDSDCLANLKCCGNGCRCVRPGSSGNPITGAVSGVVSGIGSGLGGLASGLQTRINQTLSNLPSLPSLGGK